MAVVTLNVKEKFVVQLRPVQDDGLPGQIDAPPTFPMDVPDVLTPVVSPDGLSCEFRGSKIGTCKIVPTAKANGATIVGPEIDAIVTAEPVKFATKLIEEIGPVVPQ